MNTTIAISVELKEKLKNLGRTGDTYQDVIERMYEITRKKMLTEFLYNTKDSLTLEQAKKELLNN